MACCAEDAGGIGGLASVLFEGLAVLNGTGGLGAGSLKVTHSQTLGMGGLLADGGLVVWGRDKLGALMVWDVDVWA